MTSWSISPEGINATIEKTQTSLSGISTALAGLAEGVVQPVLDGAGGDGTVAMALDAFLQDQDQGRATQIGQQFTNTVNCTINAANAYIAGDELMASASVSAAGKAETVHNTTKF